MSELFRTNRSSFIFNIISKSVIVVINLKIGLVRRELDFIKINGIGARKYRIPRSPSLTALDDMKKASDDKNNVYRKGEVPK